jgi:cyanophycin synthetase
MVASHGQPLPGNVIFFARDRNQPVLATHRAQGKRVVYVERDAIVFGEGRKKHRIPLANVPLTRNGTIGFQVENAMAAIATGWALGLDEWETIESALANFVNDAATAPGRFNVFDYKGATLIADYGHNPDAIQALVKAIENMPAKPPLGGDQRRRRPAR